RRVVVRIPCLRSGDGAAPDPRDVDRAAADGAAPACTEAHHKARARRGAHTEVGVAAELLAGERGKRDRLGGVGHRRPGERLNGHQYAVVVAPDGIQRPVDGGHSQADSRCRHRRPRRPRVAPGIVGLDRLQGAVDAVGLGALASGARAYASTVTNSLLLSPPTAYSVPLMAATPNPYRGVDIDALGVHVLLPGS